MVQRSAPAPFLTKTYQLVDDVSTDKIVSWNEIGTTFVIWSTADFAKDLLPNYFKHCNYSSFVRQLNTYGFRKITADKWEFANENFVRGKKEFLSKIRRRKGHRKSSAAADVIHLPAAPLPATPSNSGDDSTIFSSSVKNPASSSIEAPAPPPPAAAAAAPVAALTKFDQNSHDELAEENEKLKKDNEILSTELTQAKKQCDDLVAFLTKKVKVGADQINMIMRNGSNIMITGHENEIDNNNNNNYGPSSSSASSSGLKLFGVWLKKRGRDENSDFHRKEMKKSSFEFEAPWMNSNKVCI